MPPPGGRDDNRTRLTAAERDGVYAARRFIGNDLEKKLGVRIPFDVYFQDPLVAAERP